MRIAIQCRSFLNKNYTGIGRYTYHLINHLIQIDQANQYVLYMPKGIFNFKRTIPRIKAKNAISKVDFFNKGILKTVVAADIYHSPSPEDLSCAPSPKIIVTIHDLIFKTFPEGHTAATIATTEHQLSNIIDKATKLICCSQSTLNDFRKYFPQQAAKAHLVYQGVNQKDFYVLTGKEEKAAQKMLASRGIREPFVLFVGTLEPRKNLNHLLEAFRLLKTKKKFAGKLVVVGMEGWMSEDMSNRIKDMDLVRDVYLAGFVSNRELRYFYNQAAVFAFPSFYEGFGFPILEAFCCGVPVVTSNVSSCPEIADDAALKIDPRQPEEIAEAITRCLEDKVLCATLRERGFKRAQRFSFLNTAQETLKIYQEVYGGY